MPEPTGGMSASQPGPGLAAGGHVPEPGHEVEADAAEAGLQRVLELADPVGMGDAVVGAVVVGCAA